MKIILIRHGDPDYPNHTLTEKGWREARLLSKRVQKWQVSEFFSSPSGRALDTAHTCLADRAESLNVCEWLREFYFPVTDPVSGRYGVPWDFVPSFRYSEPLLSDRERWFDAPIMRTCPEIKEKYHLVCNELDAVLARHGYVRDGFFYRVNNKEKVYIKETAPAQSTFASFHNDSDEAVLVMFCHLGITCVILSHLLNIPFPLLPHSFYLAPSSVTILATEERWDNEAAFRLQVAGDTRHLYEAGEPISCAGAYFSVMQER